MNGNLVIDLTLVDNLTPAWNRVLEQVRELLPFTEFPYVDELTGRDPRMTYLEQIAS